MADGADELISIAKFVIVNGEGDSQHLHPISAPSLDASLNSNRTVRRRRVTDLERQFIWGSTNGLCYLCKTDLPRLSGWHIEHVVAFSEDPENNDVLGNMLPSCASCNLRKNDKELASVISLDSTFNLMTASKDVAHLNTAARQSILHALAIKCDRTAALQAQADVKGSLLAAIMDEVESLMRRSAEDAGQQCNLSAIAMEATLEARRLDPARVHFDVEEGSLRYGSFGEIHTGTLTIVDTASQVQQPAGATIDVAIKFPRAARRDVLQSLLQELKMLLLVKHDNIVGFYGWFLPLDQPDTFGVVLEWCSHCLDMDVPRLRVHPIKVFAEIASALEYIHSLSLVHRDVKPGNILIHKHKASAWTAAVAKLCDFGSAKMLLKNTDEHTHNAGTAEFRPPEVRRGEVTPKSDVYSLGKTMDRVRSDNAMLLEDRDLSALVEGLCKAMTEYKPEKRMSMADVCRVLAHRVEGGSGPVPPLQSSQPKSKPQPKSQAPIGSQPKAQSKLQPPVPAQPQAQPKSQPLPQPRHAQASPSASGTRATPSTPMFTPPRPPQARAAHSSAGLGAMAPPCSVPESPACTIDPPATPAPLVMTLVYLSTKARRREELSGKCNMKYHSTASCGALKPVAGTCDVALEEAREFRHEPCQRCHRSGAHDATGLSSAVAGMSLASEAPQ